MFNLKSTCTVRIIGGLGNQMFQYAFIKALSLKRGCNFKLDITGFDYYFRSFELENFNIQKNYLNSFYKGWHLNNFLKNICYKIHIISTHFMGYYREKRINGEFSMDFKNKHYFYGYWQSPVFFDEYYNEIIKDFTPKNISEKKYGNYKQI